MKSITAQFNGNNAIALGALIWMAASTVLSLRPEGHPPHSYRQSIDIMPFLGIGILLIGTGLSSYIGKAEGQVAVARKILFFSTPIYALGSVVRLLSLPGKWEPLMPIGFLGSITGLMLCGLAFKRKNFAAPVLSYCLMAAACLLLCFNDQYVPWTGIVFGAVMLSFRLFSAKFV